ncbi:unnamed protein product [Calicophoron daubneyi]|uniref:c-SKI SMAD4-binding domain-containing protein n=1 Tax=Calicophoron daubneyi TaxID=300641 RepID=A0AAV2TC18_CALDB
MEYPNHPKAYLTAGEVDILLSAKNLIPPSEKCDFTNHTGEILSSDSNLSAKNKSFMMITECDKCTTSADNGHTSAQQRFMQAHPTMNADELPLDYSLSNCSLNEQIHYGAQTETCENWNTGGNTTETPKRTEDQEVDTKMTTKIYEVWIRNQSLVCLEMDGKQRLCLAQISSTLLRDYSYNEIHNRRVALGITCVQCSPAQLELLREVGAMPSSSRRCGTITLREAERLIKSFLDEPEHPKLPEYFAFNVIHQCGWGCKGSFLPSRYNSSRAKCIRCNQCQAFFSPNKFIFHSHAPENLTSTNGSEYRHPDAANFNAWRRHLHLNYAEPSVDLVYAWEDVKAMFNGGNRKRGLIHRKSQTYLRDEQDAQFSDCSKQARSTNAKKEFSESGDRYSVHAPKDNIEWDERTSGSQTDFSSSANNRLVIQPPNGLTTYWLGSSTASKLSAEDRLICSPLGAKLSMQKQDAQKLRVNETQIHEMSDNSLWVPDVINQNIHIPDSSNELTSELLNTTTDRKVGEDVKSTAPIRNGSRFVENTFGVCPFSVRSFVSPTERQLNHSLSNSSCPPRRRNAEYVPATYPTTASHSSGQNWATVFAYQLLKCMDAPKPLLASKLSETLIAMLAVSK